MADSKNEHELLLSVKAVAISLRDSSSEHVTQSISEKKLFLIGLRNQLRGVTAYVIKGSAASSAGFREVLAEVGSRFFEVDESSVVFREPMCSEEARSKITKIIDEFIPNQTHGTPSAFGLFIMKLKKLLLKCKMIVRFRE